MEPLFWAGIGNGKTHGTIHTLLALFAVVFNELSGDGFGLLGHARIYLSLLFRVGVHSGRLDHNL